MLPVRGKREHTYLTSSVCATVSARIGCRGSELDWNLGAAQVALHGRDWMGHRRAE